MTATASKQELASIYDFTVRAQDGSMVSLNDYRDKVLLIVNTATGCGFTPQYEGLEKLYKTYYEQGFEILDFPCDQFGHQAPGSDAEIHEFCMLKYDTTFPQFGKIEVNGEGADPLYRYLASHNGGLLGGAIKWNFTKFLIARDGKILKRYAPMDTPEKIEADLKAALS
ncbi:MAG: glutathione peroxidase [Parascardovia denticolens]